MRSKPKMQHFVPKNYLSRFADDKNKIYLYDKIKKEVRRVDVGKVCCEKDFYTLPNWERVKDTFSNINIKSEGFDSLEEFEKFWNDGYFFEISYLEPLDGLSKQVIDNIINQLDKDKNLPMKSVENLFKTIIIQDLRTKKKRIQLANYLDAILRTIAKANGDNIDDKIKISYSNEYLKARHISMMQNDEILDNLMESLIGCYISVCKNETDFGFYTSDHPVAVYSNDDSSYGGSSLTSYGAEIYYPINSKYCIGLFDVRYLMSEYPIDIEKLKKNNGKIVNVTKENVLRINHLILQYSNRYVFSKSGQFNFIREIEKERLNDLKSNIGVVVMGFDSEKTIYNNASIKRDK